MTLNGEAIIDGLSGLTPEFTKELNELKAELYDKHGNPCKPSYENIDELIRKANQYTQMLQTRNNLWSAKLN